ncbi:MAG TPA: winged helix-turn-helix domain-containing protein [Terriglobia bacterium]|nr:winged helix-turn-helix domain-containing protein [Terriglobia bacterium]
MSSDKPIYQFGPFQLDSGRRLLFCDGRPVPLRQKALETLLVLLESHGELVEKQILMDKVWPETFVEEGNLSFTIHLLRKTLGDERNHGNRFIETVPRRGYRFVAPVELTVRNGATSNTINVALPAEPDATRQVSKAVLVRAGHRTWRWALVAGVTVLSLAALIAALRLHASLPSPRIVHYSQLTSDGRTKLGPLLTDGPRLYFVEKTTDGANSLVSIPVSGGDPVPIQTPFPKFTLFAVSPARSQILLGTSASGGQGEALWTLPTSGGTPRRLGNLAADCAAWSPEGQRLAYSIGPDLYLAKSNGMESQKLVTMKSSIGGISWSPDGRTLRILLHPPSGDPDEIWDIGGRGGNLRRVLQRYAFSKGGSWTPDGSYFVFTAALNSGARSFIAALDDRRSLFHSAASLPTQLGSAGPFEFISAVPGLDSEKIFALGLQHRPELARYDARLKEFVPYLRGIPAYWANLSPDGQSIAYLSLPQHALWRARPDGDAPIQLTFPPLEVDGFAWSPDGKQIAMRAREPGQPWRIYLIPSQGGAPRMLTSGTTDEGIPSWSPDGRRIVFGDWPISEAVEHDRLGIHLVDLETKATTDLPGSENLWTARWSPDGRYIAALTITSRRLRVFDWVTGKWRSLNSPPVNNPSWSHNGKYFYFDSTEVNRAIYRIRLADGKLERLASLQGTGAPTGWGSGLTPDDSLVITQDLGFIEIYALDMKWR